MKRNLLATIVVGTGLLGLFNSCSTQTTHENLESKSSNEFVTSSTSNLITVESKREKFNYFKTKYENGEDIKSELAEYLNHSILNEKFGSDSEKYRLELLSIIDPDTYNCNSSNSDLNAYLDSTLNNLTFIELLYAIFYGDYPAYDAAFFKAVGEKQSYGINGEFTNQLNRNFKNLKRFWDIPSEDIHMFAMKGTTYADIDRMVEIDQALYGDYYTVDESLEFVLALAGIFGSDNFWNFNHPLLSFNGFAISTGDSFVQDRIVIGDGILKGYEEIGLGDVAPEAILAHEYAHQIQFENGYFEDVVPEDQPNATRRTELMADAFAAYYLTHKRGATLNWWRVEQFMEAFFNIGDCSFSSSGHHGTHKQRLAAAKWGYELAEAAKVNGKILSSSEIFEMFEAELDGLINCSDCIAEELSSK